MKPIKFTTNTAYLLNTWFTEGPTLFEDVRKQIEKLHEENWKTNGIFLVEVTIKRSTDNKD